MDAASRDLRAVFSSFQTRGTFLDGAPYGSGHINSTYRVRTKESDCPDYLVQRVNHTVFKNIPALMENIVRVTAHLRKKITACGGNPDRETLTVIPASDGKPYLRDAAGNYWRVYLFIDNAASYDIVDSPLKAKEGGRMFGRFQRMLADIPGGPLFETIPDFHDIEKRLAAYAAMLARDPAGRASSVQREIGFVAARAEEMPLVLRLGRAGTLPLRITHNDTKFNNVLLDENGKGLSVIDLDTVMPGYVHYDFGDSIRTAANTAAEDERDTSKVAMDIGLFEAYAAGYLSEARSFLTPAEMEHLAFSAKLLTFTIGLRFLTDYLAGDVYFRTKYPEHNIVRARAQFALLASMEKQFNGMRRIIERLAR